MIYKAAPPTSKKPAAKAQEVAMPRASSSVKLLSEKFEKVPEPAPSVPKKAATTIGAGARSGSQTLGKDGSLKMKKTWSYMNKAPSIDKPLDVAPTATANGTADPFPRATSSVKNVASMFDSGKVQNTNAVVAPVDNASSTSASADPAGAMPRTQSSVKDTAALFSGGSIKGGSAIPADGESTPSMQARGTSVKDLSSKFQTGTISESAAPKVAATSAPDSAAAKRAIFENSAKAAEAAKPAPSAADVAVLSPAVKDVASKFNQAATQSTKTGKQLPPTAVEIKSDDMKNRLAQYEKHAHGTKGGGAPFKVAPSDTLKAKMSAFESNPGPKPKVYQKK